VDPRRPAARRRPFTFSDPNFNFRSLRGSAVLRWEYRPGSTMFVVWTQGAQPQRNRGRPGLLADMRALLDAPVGQHLLVKFNYWVGF